MRSLPDEKVRHILLLHKRGLPIKEIAKIVGCSVGAVHNRVKAQAPQPAPMPEVQSVEDIPEEIPEGAPLEIADRWIPKLEKAIAAAEATKDFGAMSSLMAKLVALLEHKRKAAPPELPDPNQNPDFIEAARKVRERWHKLLEGLAGK